MPEMKHYRKAFYKKSVRNKVELKLQPLNNRIAKFLFQKYTEKYVEMFGASIEPLVNTGVEEKIHFGVIEYANNIVCVFLTDGSGKYFGNLNGVPLTRKELNVLEYYNIERN